MIQAHTEKLTNTTADPTPFSLAETRKIVADCFVPKPWIYWTDFAFTFGLGMVCFQRVRGGNLLVPHQGWTGEPFQAIYFLASCLLFYRAAMFIHELVHQRRNNQLRAFSIVWNLLCGIPFLMPTFVYYMHIDHHRRAHYGTDQDGEYLPLVGRGPAYMLFYLSWCFVIPVFVVIRFMVLSPIGWCVPPARRWIHQHLSSMVMDPSYIRPLPTQQTLRIMRIQELGCFLWCWGVAILPPLLLGRWPIPFVIHAYLTGVVILTLNSVRTLGSHRWQNDREPMSFVGQLLDSVNYPRRPWLTELWAPVGSRFHALHHLFPSMPYHAMPRAHRQLMEHLPADSPYRATNSGSLWTSVRQLLRDANQR